MRVPRFGSVPDDVPWLSPSRQVPSRKAPSPAGRATRQRVLLVEDDSMLGFALQGVLESRFAVEIAVDATRALQILQASTAPFDVILTDERLPAGRGGVELLKEVRRRHPQVRRLLMTDDASRLPWEEGLWEHVLQKPFELEELLEDMSPSEPMYGT